MMEYTRLCVRTPIAGGRVFEAGDEKILKFATPGENYKVFSM